MELSVGANMVLTRTLLLSLTFISYLAVGGSYHEGTSATGQNSTLQQSPSQKRSSEVEEIVGFGLNAVPSEHDGKAQRTEGKSSRPMALESSGPTFHTTSIIQCEPDSGVSLNVYLNHRTGDVLLERLSTTNHERMATLGDIRRAPEEPASRPGFDTYEIVGPLIIGHSRSTERIRILIEFPASQRQDTHFGRLGREATPLPDYRARMWIPSRRNPGQGLRTCHLTLVGSNVSFHYRLP